VEDRWHSIGDREKVSPESFDIRIRDPANSEIPIEVTGVEKSTPHVYRSFGTSEYREFGKVQSVDIASCETAIRSRSPDKVRESQR
jgi:hypothetical protein